MNHEDRSREELFTDPEEIVTFAQAYYATEFPNDGRRHCPPAETLREAAHSASPPNEPLRSHLFSCSECFRSYRSARMSRRARARFVVPRWGRLRETLADFKSPLVPVAVGACCLAFVGLITAALLWRAPADSPTVAANYSRQESQPATSPEVIRTRSADVPEPNPSSPTPAAPTLKVSPRAARAATRNPRTRPPLRIVEIDLKADDLLRGDGETGSGRRVITLSPERQRLRLRMPRGSAAGRYTVRVVDAYGKPLLTAAAKSSGRTLTVELDLSGLSSKVYRLCVAREGEAPDCYLMSVGENSSAP